MISSIIWLVMIQTGYINSDYAPWNIYLPIYLIEVVVYFKLLTKWGENE